MGKINFDAQRAEAGVDGHEITVAGRDIALVPVLSVRFGLAINEGNLEEAIGLMVADSADVGHLLDNLGMDELDQIAESLYGLTGDGSAPNREARRAG